jgi:hypothetical protein
LDLSNFHFDWIGMAGEVDQFLSGEMESGGDLAEMEEDVKRDMEAMLSAELNRFEARALIAGFVFMQDLFGL